MSFSLKKALMLGVAAISLGTTAKADKGMWLLNELSQENLRQIKELGFQLTPDSLYSLSKPSVANSVVIFGRGCTGVTVSKQGLIMTNHHCGYDAIQSQSTVDHDYLRDGFISHTLEQELPIEGLQIRYLSDIKDVTSTLLAKLRNPKNETDRLTQLQKLSNELITKENKRLKNKHKEVIIRPYYAGNKYYMLTYDVFSDVRMVFAPPSSIGKFGGDTDNWMWPRHTGDFSVFRVYADKNNNPALYNKDNVPYTPKYFAAVSTQGYGHGDYAMTIGFPGSTERYIPSWGIENRMSNENDPRIEVRGIKQAIWRKAMDADQATRIKYASKYAVSSNYWKNSIGMNRGLKRLGVVERKQAEEKAFDAWVRNNSKPEYAGVLSRMEQAYKASGDANRRSVYVSETLLRGTEIVEISRMLQRYADEKDPKVRKRIMEQIDLFYKDYVPALDQEVLPAMLDVLRKNIKTDEAKIVFDIIDQKFGGDTKAFAADLFTRSIVPHKEQVSKILSEDDFKKHLQNDPAVLFSAQATMLFGKIRDERARYSDDINSGNRLYFAGRMEMDPKRPMPSDANFTMRMSYGSIKGYTPADAITYDYYTTPRGILEKYQPGSTEFDLKADFLDLVKKGEWGRWADHAGKMHVAFLSNNDITGGNSGSPVFDKNGRVIGLAFDGNWEAMSGDIEFEPELQRTISVDIRYVLFVIDKWGKCPRLIEELDLR